MGTIRVVTLVLRTETVVAKDVMACTRVASEKMMRVVIKIEAIVLGIMAISVLAMSLLVNLMSVVGSVMSTLISDETMGSISTVSGMGNLTIAKSVTSMSTVRSTINLSTEVGRMGTISLPSLSKYG